MYPKENDSPHSSSHPNKINQASKPSRHGPNRVEHLSVANHGRMAGFPTLASTPLPHGERARSLLLSRPPGRVSHRLCEVVSITIHAAAWPWIDVSHIVRGRCIAAAPGWAERRHHPVPTIGANSQMLPRLLSRRGSKKEKKVGRF